jgi:hypothetical protein
LSYDVAFNGTVSLQAPAGGTSFLSGLPIDANLNSKGQATLETLRVTDTGSGVMAVRVNSMNTRATALGQVIELAYRDGAGSLRMNGQPMAQAGGLNWKKLQNPLVGWQISKRGRFESLVPLGAGEAEDPEKPASDKPMSLPLPINIGALIQSLIAQTMPSLWPDREVNAGDKWTSELRFPTLQRSGAAEQAPLGKVDLTLKGEEQVAGRTVQRVGLDGTIEISEQQAAALAKLPTAVTPAPGEKSPSSTGPAKATEHLSSGRQKIKGDLWFDAAAGQMVRGELELQGHGESRPKGAKSAEDNGFMDIAGTLQLNLRKVSYAGDGSHPATTPPM